jgi:CRP-like cAMP-binding protein
MPVSVDRLRALPLFEMLSEDELAVVSRFFQERQASPGSRLTVQGASGYFFFVIEDGVVEVERDGLLLTTLGPGDFFGEMAILTGERRNATVTAASTVELLTLFGTEFRVLDSTLPSAAEKIRQKMTERAESLPQPD